MERIARVVYPAFRRHDEQLTPFQPAVEPPPKPSVRMRGWMQVEERLRDRKRLHNAFRPAAQSSTRGDIDLIGVAARLVQRPRTGEWHAGFGLKSANQNRNAEFAMNSAPQFLAFSGGMSERS